MLVNVFVYFSSLQLHCVCERMCETNDSLPVVGGNNRVWPPADGASAASGSDVDEIWDDSELIAHYKQVEMQVKVRSLF